MIYANILSGLRMVSCRFAGMLWKWSFGKRAGKGLSVGRNVYIMRNIEIRAGRNFRILDDATIATGSKNGFLHVGDDVEIGQGCRIDVTGGITMGDRVHLSREVKVYTHSHGHHPRSMPDLLSLDVGDDVWVGSAATILQSARTLEPNAVVAANAVVTKPVGACAIVAGNPATIMPVNRSSLQVVGL